MIPNHSHAEHSIASGLQDQMLINFMGKSQNMRVGVAM
jgi:hypothetical protein